MSIFDIVGRISDCRRRQERQADWQKFLPVVEAAKCVSRERLADLTAATFGQREFMDRRRAECIEGLRRQVRAEMPLSPRIFLPMEIEGLRCSHGPDEVSMASAAIDRFSSSEETAKEAVRSMDGISGHALEYPLSQLVIHRERLESIEVERRLEDARLRSLGRLEPDFIRDGIDFDVAEVVIQIGSARSVAELSEILRSVRKSTVPEVSAPEEVAFAR